MSIKNILKKAASSAKVDTDELIRISKGMDKHRNKIIAPNPNKDSGELIHDMLGIKITEQGAVALGAMGVAAGLGSSVYGQAVKADHGEIYGSTVANAVNSAETGVTSPALARDLHHGYLSERSMTAGQSAISGDIVFAMHHLR